jgi:hypothetical protein
VNGKLVWDPPYTAAELKQKNALFQDMVQSQIPPGYSGQLDRRFIEGRVRDHGIGHLPLAMQRSFIERAKRAGIDITGKVYATGLADGRGPATPEAWVGGIDDYKATLIKQGKSCHGLLNITAPAPEQGPDVELADDIVVELAEEYVKENPKLLRDPVELKEMIVEKHGAPAQRRAKPKFRCRQDIDRIPEPDSPD